MAPRTVRTTLRLGIYQCATDRINTLDKVTERGIEWDCQKALRQYYNLIDHREFETAVELFTEDVTWRLRGLDLTGRDAILKALYAGSGSGGDTIRHIVNNIIVNVIDEDHAELRTYTTIYYSDCPSSCNWDKEQPSLKEDPAHLIQDIKRRICGIASAGFPSFSV
jgi:hypothetical protein